MSPRLPRLDNITDDAEFSLGGDYRYWLSRRVAEEGPVGLFLGLNPSKAGAMGDDHTVRKWKGFASRWGWSGFLVGNLFTFIETKSAKLKGLAPHQVNDEHSDQVLTDLMKWAPTIVLCWGNNVPKHLNSRVARVLDMLSEHHRQDFLYTFGLSKSGSPTHPLTLGYDTPLRGYTIARRLSRRERD